MARQACTMTHGVHYRSLCTRDGVGQFPAWDDRREFRGPGDPGRQTSVGYEKAGRQDIE